MRLYFRQFDKGLLCKTAKETLLLSYFKTFEKIFFFLNPCDIKTSREVQLYIKGANIMLDIIEQLNVTGESRFSLTLLELSNPYLQGYSWNS